MLALSAGGWILFLQSLFVRFIRHGWFASHAVAMINALTIYTIITVFFYRIFIIEERDQKIFDRYINKWESNPNKKRDLFIASFIAVAPYLSMFSIKLLLRNWE